MIIFWAIGASIVVSLVSLVGIFSLLFNEKLLDKILILLVGFAAGGLIGAAFLHLLPEALERTVAKNVFFYVILGFILFFVLERYFHWRHCHEGACDIHAFSYLSLIGDSTHNLIDGLIIGASFVISVRFGIITTLAIIFHEIPQEMGDFGILVYGGFSKFKALFYNFLSAVTAIIGALLGYYFTERIGDSLGFLLPFAAGGFIYIASCDLIPELHKEADIKKSTYSMLAFLFGILFMLLTKLIHH